MVHIGTSSRVVSVRLVSQSFVPNTRRLSVSAFDINGRSPMRKIAEVREVKSCSTTAARTALPRASLGGRPRRRTPCSPPTKAITATIICTDYQGDEAFLSAPDVKVNRDAVRLDLRRWYSQRPAIRSGAISKAAFAGGEAPFTGRWFNRNCRHR